MRSTRRRFRPRLIPTLVVFALVPLFISFGQWQWNKASAKSGLQSLLDVRSTEPPQALPATQTDPQSMRFRQIIVRGVYEPQYQILIDNRIHREQAGYHVVTPLRIEGSEMRVLVNRGWIPALAEHHRVPEVATPTGTVEVAGIALVPASHFFTLGKDAAGTDGSQWRRVWQNLDLASYGKATTFPLHGIVVQLSPDSSAGGFAREWPRPDDRLERHLGYAFQWWGFAAAAVLIWLVVNFRRDDDASIKARL